ncbi:hypothetical protein N9359_04195 [Luminiphilus sp.]|nr:hypothetical protein [Luminiphilus sp.]
MSVIEISLHISSLRSGGAPTLDVFERFWYQFSSIPSYVLGTVPSALLCSLTILPMHVVRQLKILPSKLFSSIKRWILVGFVGLGALDLYKTGYF